MAGSSKGMIRLVAVVTAALKVTSIVVGLVRLALIAVMPARFVVYAGTPLSATGWLNTTLIVEPVLVALTTPIGTVGTGRFSPFFRRGNRCLGTRLIALGMVAPNRGESSE